MPTSLLLSDAHRRMLIEGSAISEDVIAERTYRTIPGNETSALQALGFARYQCRAGLLIPVWSIDSEICGYQLRPDIPRVLKSGRALKYETPTGSKLRIDVPPRVRPNLGDPSRALWITEGAKKVDSLISQGIDAIGVLGVYGWRGTNSTGGKTASADWDSIALNGREIILAFDNDLYGNPKVHRALSEFAKFLARKGAEVRYAPW